MNRIELTDDALAVAEASASLMVPLAQICQYSLDTITQRQPIAGSMAESDLQLLLAEEPDGRLPFLNEWVRKHTMTRGIAVMDSLLAIKVVLDAVHDEETRTGTSAAILARSVLETSLSIAYHLDGDLESRLLRAYASLLGDYQQSLLAFTSLPLVPDDIAANAVAQARLYKELRAAAERLDYTFDTHDRKKCCGLPRVQQVRNRHRDCALTDPTATDHARRYGSAEAEFYWRLASGVSHGRVWSTMGPQVELEMGTNDGSVYLTVAATAQHGVSILVQSIARYSGDKSLLSDLKDITEAHNRTPDDTRPHETQT